MDFHIMSLNYVTSKLIFDFGNQDLARTSVLPYLSQYCIQLNLANPIVHSTMGPNIFCSHVGSSFFCHQTEIFSFWSQSQNIGKLWKQTWKHMPLYFKKKFHLIYLQIFMLQISFFTRLHRSLSSVQFNYKPGYKPRDLL